MMPSFWLILNYRTLLYFRSFSRIAVLPNKKTNRLYFIDAIRAWAILMMLQGHFIDGLLDTAFRDNSDAFYATWKYFRGMTAPVFFTVSGFIFTYLLVRVPEKGFQNPRVKKGLKRGVELLVIAYALRLNLGGLLMGKLYDTFFLVDVLHCIGFSILGIIFFYLVSYAQSKVLFALLLFCTSMLLFIFEPLYAGLSFETLPKALANYFTRQNGSVFTIIPWFGYAAFGGFISLLFTRYKAHKNLYTSAILISVLAGLFLIFFSSDVFVMLHELFDIQLFNSISLNNYLFIRLGDVFLIFAIFMIVRKWLTNSTFLKIGQSTLSIYVIHFIILYGSFTGQGLYRYYHHSLTLNQAILGAIAFMVLCSFLALRYEKYKTQIKSFIVSITSRLFGFIKN